MGDRHVIDPHGGVLVNRLKDGLSGVETAATIQLSERQQCDLEMIVVGAMSPLTGFVGEADYHSICDSMTLTGGAVWPIPVTCAVDDATAAKVSVGDQVALNDDQGRLLGYLTVEEKYKQDKKKQAIKAYGTDDEAHPGVKVVYGEGDTCLAGPIDVVTARHDPMFADHRLGPARTRAEFAKRGWNTVVAFQTRNPIHRAHEYLTKYYVVPR